MPRRVLVHISTMETQQVSTNRNSVQDCASLLKLVISTSKQCPKSVTDCVVTQSTRHKKLASMICTKLLTEDSAVLTHNICEEWFSLLLNTNPKNHSANTAVLTKRGEYEAVCLAATTLLTLLVQMDPVIHPSEGHRSDMLLDLSGLTSEERVMVQASISNERDLDRVAEALIHLRESPIRTKGKGSNVLMIQTLVGFAEKARANTLTGIGKSGAIAHYAKITSVEDYDYYDLRRVILQTPIKPTTIQLTPEATNGGEALDHDDDEENDTFSPHVALDDITVFEAAELDASALLAER